jgi:hypothetical protein
VSRAFRYEVQGGTRQYKAGDKHYRKSCLAYRALGAGVHNVPSTNLFTKLIAAVCSHRCSTRTPHKGRPAYAFILAIFLWLWPPYDGYRLGVRDLRCAGVFLIFFVCFIILGVFLSVRHESDVETEPRPMMGVADADHWAIARRLVWESYSPKATFLFAKGVWHLVSRL